MHVRDLVGTDTAAVHSAVELVHQHAWSSRTTSSRQSQWRALQQFCRDCNLTPLPAKEAHFLSFFGWLKHEKELGKRKVGATSIPQYLTAVRQMHQLVIGVDVPKYPFVDMVQRAY